MNEKQHKLTHKQEELLHTDVEVEAESDFHAANAVHDRVSGKSSLGIFGEVLSGADDERSDEYNEIAHYGGPAKHADPSFFTGLGQGWDSFVNRIRTVTPAMIVNSSSRLSFGSRAAADSLSVYSGLRYSSFLRTTGSAITLAGLGAGLVFNEKPQTAEDRERYKQMPMSQYIPMRIRHAFDPQHHITATVGLATIPNGLLLAGSGLQQSTDTAKKALKEVSKGNLNALKMLGKKGAVSAELWTGLMTVAAGTAMNFIPDQDRAWQVSTGIFLSRALPAYNNAARAYKYGKPAIENPLYPAGASVNNPFGVSAKVWRDFRKANPDHWKAEPGDWMQMGKFALNQGSNVFGLFYGGVTKMPDGSIVKTKAKEPGAITEADSQNGIQRKGNVFISSDEKPSAKVCGSQAKEDGVAHLSERTVTQGA